MINVEDRNELIVKYMPLADKLANNKKRKVNYSVALDELKSAAYLGLIDAANKFDNEKASKDSKDPFASYATRRISGQMTDFLRSCYWLGTRKKPIPVYSIDTNSYFDDGKANISKDRLESKSPPPHEILNREELFNRIIRGLPLNVQEAFRLYFIHNRTMKEIGEEISLSESRISQLMSQHISFLRATLKSKQEHLFKEAEAVK